MHTSSCSIKSTMFHVVFGDFSTMSILKNRCPSMLQCTSLSPLGSHHQPALTWKRAPGRIAHAHKDASASCPLMARHQNDFCPPCAPAFVSLDLSPACDLSGDDLCQNRPRASLFLSCHASSAPFINKLIVVYVPAVNGRAN